MTPNEQAAIWKKSPIEWGARQQRALASQNKTNGRFFCSRGRYPKAHTMHQHRLDFPAAHAGIGAQRARDIRRLQMANSRRDLAHCDTPRGRLHLSGGR